MKKVIVTGGAGFIGSHLVKHLADNGHDVKVLDNFLSGKKENLVAANLVVKDVNLQDRAEVLKEIKDMDVVYHFAADPDVKSSSDDPDSHFNNNLLATYNILEAMRQHGIKYLVFASSSVVYGEADLMPTPEDYKMNPISIYGATKLACEALITGYVASFGIKALMFRPANIIGSHSTHGVILDFIKKLKSNPKEMEILGDGTQQKSYLHVSDFVKAVMHSFRHFVDNDLDLEIYNVGSNDTTTVMEIAQIITDEMGLKDVQFNLTQKIAGGRGWIGDVKTMLLSIQKLENIGWKPTLTSTEAVKRTAHELCQ